MNFKTLSVITSIVAGTLCASLLIYPEIIFTLFNIEHNSAAFFIGRRAAMLFLGITVMSWAVRNTAHSQTQQAICLGHGFAMLGMSFMGVTEFVRGYVSAGIFIAIVTEAILAYSYFKIWLSLGRPNNE